MTERSPSPSEVGFSIVNRRQILGGMAGMAGAAFLAACGSSSKSTASSAASSSTSAAGSSSSAAASSSSAAASSTTAAAAGGKSTGTLTWGSNQGGNPKPIAAYQAVADAFPNKNVQVKINTIDHNSFQDNITTYLQQPDDVFTWFSGLRMRFFASKGLAGDISDVWKNASGLSDAFKTASTGDDGKQYLVPWSYYAWGVHYRKSFFQQKGYKVPTKWDEFMALMDKMKTDGVTPLAAANDGKWPQQGMFDQLNLRINGYQFHTDLMAGKKDWSSPEVKAVFDQWAKILPYYQQGANGRTWQTAADDWAAGKTGMYLLGNFVTSNFKDQATIDDIDFFPFPEINPAYGQEAVEAPIDGLMMAAKPKNMDAAKEFLTYLTTSAAQQTYVKTDTSVVMSNSGVDPGGYSAIQKKALELISKAKYITQFLDRDSNPQFASNVAGPGFADFIADPTKSTSIMKNMQDQAKVIFAG
jgi:multiple sugar transport system substrate-binding protein